MNQALILIVSASLILFLLGFIFGWILVRRVIGRNVVDTGMFNRLNEEAITLRVRLAEKSNELDTVRGELLRERERTRELGARFNEEFRNIANQILLKNASDFSRLSGERMQDILKPLREQITSFEKKIEVTREKQIAETTSLKQQISQLTNLNQAMSEDARNLTLALKGESKTRGTWGEMILEKILDSSGLIKDEHYTLQSSLRGADEERLLPDALIHLPEGRHLIIDSKVSLVAYERYCSNEDPAAREACMKEHILSMKTHINQLSAKEYQKAQGIGSPDFILMFVPIEPALVVALEKDRELFSYAWNRNIAIISPTTLIPTLKIIYNIWRQESQNLNAEKIAKAGGSLYDKLVGFVEDLLRVGEGIDRTKEHYENAVKKLKTGKGNLIGMAEKMKAMGARASKSIPAEVGEEED